MSPSLRRDMSGGQMLLRISLIASLALAVSSTSSIASPDTVASVYLDDPDIVAKLNALPAGSSMLLPKVRVDSLGIDKYSYQYYGPGRRDYCNKMPYAPDRGTALYAGGNHQVPHRMNDVWEYHLGSNTWHLLYAPDGGNAGAHKPAYFLTSRSNLVHNPEKELTPRQKQQLEAYRQWWNTYVHLTDGDITTTRGGPVMPAHTWDAFTYDPRVGRLIWGLGANPAAQPATYAYFSNQSLEQVEAQLDKRYTPMWMFDPKAKRWIHYKTKELDTPRAALRGMGATMQYIPDLGKSIWYVAAQNVSPPAFEMWTYDAVEDSWQELRPNGGKSIGELAGKLDSAPKAEQQVAYSPKDRKLVAVLKHDTYVYDIATNAWSKVATDKRIFGHDANSVFGYDPHADAFILAFKSRRNAINPSLATFSLKTMKWTLLEPNGPAIPHSKNGYAGYFDPRFNVFVLQGRKVSQVWVYRHSK